MNDMSASKRGAWLWAAALAPAAALLPVAAARAGAGGWVAPILALPGVLAAERLLQRVSGRGFAHSLRNVLGVKLGRVLTIIYIVWAVVLGGVQLHMCIRRLATVEPAGETWLTVGAVVLLAVWFTRRTPVVMVRWAALVLVWLLVGLGAVAGLALLQVRWDNLVPLWSDGGGLLGAAATTLGVLCVRVYGGFLQEGAEHETRGGIWLSATVCVVLSALLLAAQGSLGVELAAQLENPVLALVRNVGIEGAFQRAESLVAAVLLLADLALVTLLLCAIETGAGQMWRVSRWKTAVVAAAAMLGCAAAVSDDAQMEVIRMLVPGGNLVLGIAVPLFVLVIMRARARKTGAYLVSENEENGTY